MAADLKAPNETPQMIIEQLTSDLDQLIDSARAGETMRLWKRCAGHTMDAPGWR